jgi:hypothetical protein
VARSSDRHCHFFRNHDFCLALAASTASFLIPITACMALRISAVARFDQPFFGAHDGLV